jgi:DNA-binding MarR family transcriptional regulator
MTFDFDNALANRFLLLSMSVRATTGECARQLGLSTASWHILSVIGRHEPMFPSVAARLSAMDAEKVTRTVDRLVELGYVIRNTDAADRRRVILCLTPRGRTALNKLAKATRACDARWRSALTPEENSLLDAIVDKLRARAPQLGTRALTRRAGRSKDLQLPAR